VKQNEAGLRSGKVTAESVDTQKIQALIKSFADGWKRSIDGIDSDVMRSFPNFQNGTAILQEALTQLVLYYERFVALLKQVGAGDRRVSLAMKAGLPFLNRAFHPLTAQPNRIRFVRLGGGRSWWTDISLWSR
jgi:hypothetical protein